MLVVKIGQNDLSLVHSVEVPLLRNSLLFSPHNVIRPTRAGFSVTVLSRSYRIMAAREISSERFSGTGDKGSGEQEPRPDYRFTF